MAKQDHDISLLRNELTVAHWHLDASVHSGADAMRRHRERARGAYERVLEMLPHLQLSLADREAIERELSALRSRIDVA